MFKFELYGTYLEMGMKYGKILKEAGFAYEPFQQDRADFANICEQEAKKYAPNILEFIRGMAEGGNFDYDRLKTLPLVLNYGFVPKPSCTVGYVPSSYTKSGYPILFRNYDWDFSSESVFTMRKMYPTGKNASITFTDLWAGAYGGINDKGLMVAITAAAFYNGIWKPGLSVNVIVSTILDNEETVEGAVKYLQTISHMGAFHFVVVDRNRNIARVLATPEKVHVDRFHDEVVAQTNHILIDSMKELENIMRVDPSSPIRYKNTLEWIENNRSEITLKSIEKFCTNPINLNGIHEDAEYQGIKFGTIWSWIYDFKTQKLWVSPGNPKNNAYQNENL